MINAKYPICRSTGLLLINEGRITPPSAVWSSRRALLLQAWLMALGSVVTAQEPSVRNRTRARAAQALQSTRLIRLILLGVQVVIAVGMGVMRLGFVQLRKEIRRVG